MTNTYTEHPNAHTATQRQYDLKALQMLFTLRKTFSPETIVVMDIETTGLEIGKDEILQISMINGKGETLLDEYVRPKRVKTWPESEKIHGISPEMVTAYPELEVFVPKINEILRGAQIFVGYNSDSFDLPFLSAEGITVPEHTHTCDVMKDFAVYYGEWLASKSDYRWKSLEFCASYFRYKPVTGSFAHNSLYDALATLHCYNAMMDVALSHSFEKEVTRNEG